MKVMSQSRFVQTNRFVIKSIPFCLFAPIAAGVGFSFHPFYNGRVTDAAVGKDRLLISCWLGFPLDFGLRPLVFIKVTFDTLEFQSSACTAPIRDFSDALCYVYFSECEFQISSFIRIRSVTAEL